MTREFDTTPPQSDPVSRAAHPYGDLGEQLEAELTSLNRRLREMTADLTRLGAPHTPAVTQRPAGANGPLAPHAAGFGAAAGHEASAGVELRAQERAREIVEAAQRTADEIIRGAQEQATRAHDQIASLHAALRDAERQSALAPRQALGELVSVGEQLLSCAGRVLASIESYARSAPATGEDRLSPGVLDVRAPGPSSTTPIPFAHRGRALLIDEYEGAAQSFAPDEDLAPAGLARPGVYTSGSLRSAHRMPAGSPEPAVPVVHRETVTLTAGPLPDVADAAVLERAVGRIPAVAHSRVKRFVDGRVSIELGLTGATVLTEELRRVMPYPFEVLAVAPSEIDVAITAVSRQDIDHEPLRPESPSE